MESLDQLAIKYGSDKSSKHHGYCDVYERYFAPLRHSNISFLEIGVGGYHYPERGGEGLRMWDEYFDCAKWVVGIDKFDKSFKIGITRIIKCDQTDSEGLTNLMNEYNFDVIVEDASHINPLTIRTFEILFPQMKSGGIYAIEDTHTSYWESIASDGHDFKGGNHEGTVMNYFKRLCDEVCLGKRSDIEGIHFYKQQIFIIKK